MSISTIDARAWRAIYQRCDDAPEGTPAHGIATTVDAMFKGVTDAIELDGWGFDGDDNAESLVDAAELARRHFLAQLTALAPYIEPYFPTHEEDMKCPA